MNSVEYLEYFNNEFKHERINEVDMRSNRVRGATSKELQHRYYNVKNKGI